MEIISVLRKDLKPNEKNPRKITKRELQKLVRSIKEFGFVDPIIVNKNKTRYNIIVGGHQRVEAAKKLNIKEVPVTYVDLTEEKEALLNMALNEISGEWDDDKLLNLLKELEERGIDLTLSGFDEPILDEILARNIQSEKEKNIDQTPKVPDNWTQYGLEEDGTKVVISDNQRYKMMGNAVTTNVIECVAGRICKALCHRDQNE